MECYAGLDVSLELTSVCIMGADGKIVREGKVATDPGEIGQYLHRAGVALKRVGLEAGATHSGFTAAWRRLDCRWSVSRRATRRRPWRR